MATNLITNGDFSNGMTNWFKTGPTGLATFTVVGGQFQGAVGGQVVLANPDEPRLVQNINVPASATYRLRFVARSTHPVRPQIVLSGQTARFDLGTTSQAYEFFFPLTTNPSTQIQFVLGGLTTYSYTMTLDNVTLYNASQLSTLTATALPDQAGVQLDASFLPPVSAISIGRHDSSGFSQLIRYGDRIPLVAGKATVYDYEAPLDEPVYYTATQVEPAGPPDEVATSLTITLPSNGVTWLKDPVYPSMSVKIPIVTSINTLTRAARSGVFNIIDRPAPIVVTSRRRTPAGELVAHTLTNDERVAMTDLLARGTVLLLQTPPEYGFGSRYVHIGDTIETRLSVAMEPSRRWSLPFIEVDRPEGLTVNPTKKRTWQAVKDTYATWDDLGATGMTWRQLREEGP